MKICRLKKLFGLLLIQKVQKGHHFMILAMKLLQRRYGQKKRFLLTYIKFSLAISSNFCVSAFGAFKYPKSSIRVRRIPVAVQVSPIRIRVEPRDSCSTSIKYHCNANIRSKLTQGSSLLLTVIAVFYWLSFRGKHYGYACSLLSLVFVSILQGSRTKSTTL